MNREEIDEIAEGAIVMDGFDDCIVGVARFRRRRRERRRRRRRLRGIVLILELLFLKTSGIAY